MNVSYLRRRAKARAALKASGPEWEVQAVHDFDDLCSATPAIVDGKIYVRTRGALYAFGKK